MPAVQKDHRLHAKSVPQDCCLGENSVIYACRFWEAYVRGGYGQHGETYLCDEEILWWSHGGKIKGTSPERIAFLKKIMEENGGYMQPLTGMFDETVGTNVHLGSRPNKPCTMYYYGADRPSGRPFFFE